MLRRRCGGGAAVFGASMLCVWAGCGGGGDLCDGDAARDALGSASLGETVALGACEVQGPLTVPAGVTLAGGPMSVVVAPDRSAGVILEGGREAAALENVTVRVDGRVGVLARGGAVSVRGVSIQANRGVGFAADRVLSLSLTEVTIDGPIDETNAGDSRFLRVVPFAPPAAACPAGTTCACEPGSTGADGRVCDASGQYAELTATYGLYLEETTGTLTDVTVSGFASFGVVAIGGTVSWDGGAIEDTLGVALRQSGGIVDLTDVVVERTHQGVRGTPPYGIASTDGAMLQASAVEVSRNDRYGIVVLESAALLGDLLAEGNGDAAVWAGDATGLEITGVSRLAGNSFAGIVVVDSTSVAVRDVSVEATALSVRSVGELDAVSVGDGMHLIGSTTGVEVSGATFAMNQRAGLVLDFGASGMGEGIELVALSVDGMGEQLGAVAGRFDGSHAIVPVAPGTWDVGITRLGSTAVNDAAATGLLDAIGAAAPSGVPDPSEAVGVIAPMF